MHTGGSDAPLTDYAGFALPVLAPPADGRTVEVTDGYADNPPVTNSGSANQLVDIGGGRYVSMAHIEQAAPRFGGRRRAARPVLAVVGNNGHSSEPHLHFQAPAGSNADRTYPKVFRNVRIATGGAWPWGDSRGLRSGDLVRAPGR